MLACFTGQRQRWKTLRRPPAPGGAMFLYVWSWCAIRKFPWSRPKQVCGTWKKFCLSYLILAILLNVFAVHNCLLLRIFLVMLYRRVHPSRGIGLWLVLLVIFMGGATGGVGGQCPPHFWDQRGTGGYRGRSNENDLCFYSRQSLLQVTEFQLPWLVVDTCQVNDIWKDGLGRVSTVHPHWTAASVA